jgi:aminopeptidase-like protein
MEDGLPSFIGEQMHAWARDLWSLPRSLTGAGVRATFAYLRELLPGLATTEIPSGSQALDWQVPLEWSVRDAYVIGPKGQRFADWRVNNLHLVGYSIPVDQVLSREELDRHLYSIESLPHAIPYVTSYYEERWGFCLSHYDRERLPDGDYHVVVDSDLMSGHLTYADLVIPGESDQEVVFSTYVCHPSMANNELSGIVVSSALARWLMARGRNFYTYRFIFVPETIGTLCYLEHNLSHLKSNVRAGWVVSCVGDEGPYSMVQSRTGENLSQRLLVRSLNALGKEVVAYSWLYRGSDERQWCAPGIDLPMCGFSRSKYGTFPEYHNSLDDLTFVTPKGLSDSLDALKGCVQELENSPRYITTALGEPQMGRRGLYPTLSNQSGGAASADERALASRTLMNVLSYCDGDHDSEDIGTILGIPSAEVDRVATLLLSANLVRR